MRSIAIVITAAVMLFAVIHFINLSHKTPRENYPEDSWLGNAQNKTALIIVAHDDDAISAAGTISRLCREGWTVKQLCFYNIPMNEKENQRVRRRQQDTETVKEIQGLNEFRFFNLPYRNTSGLSFPEWMPLPKEKFKEQYDKDTLLYYIRRFIEENKPSVIFTLDNQIGGSGHPDHVMVSQLVLDECRQHAADSAYPVNYIYQAVFTPSMAASILDDLPAYKAALEVYHAVMPVPDIQVTISSFGSQKKEVMKAYSTEQKSIRKIWPSYRYYPAAIYFRLFDKEFFKTIKLK